VEDAGAKGFLLLMEGVVDAALERPVAATSATEETVVAATAETAAEPVDGPGGEFRFCTECLITAAGIDRRKP
jgi:dihydroxyacetone kinase-like predicted kinase